VKTLSRTNEFEPVVAGLLNASFDAVLQGFHIYSLESRNASAFLISGSESQY
jgi:hypothetical protein